MSNATDSFIEYLFTKKTDIKPHVISKAHACLADYIAVAEAGAYCSRNTWKVFLARIGQGMAPVIGYGVRSDALTACLVNGYNAHCLELDDGQRFAMLHPGTPVITALISALSEYQFSSEDFYIGLIMGYETACRLAIAIQPGHKKKGFHAAGTCGTIGAAVAVAFALRMDAHRMKTVLSAAIGSAAGILEMQEQGSLLKPYNLSRAAMDGLASAMMGFTGLPASDDMLGGPRGFFKLLTDGCDMEKLTAATDGFEIERCYVKPYAACRHCHSPIEAALALCGKINPEEIASIIVRTYKLALKGHDHTKIIGTSSAKLSIPYSVAASLVLGTGGMEAFSESAVKREDILTLASKVRVEEGPLPPSLPPDARYATVTIKSKDGREFSSSVDFAKGDSENPLGRDEFTAKITLLLQYAGRNGDLLPLCISLYDGKVNVAQILPLL